MKNLKILLFILVASMLAGCGNSSEMSGNGALTPTVTPVPTSPAPTSTSTPSPTAASTPTVAPTSAPTPTTLPETYYADTPLKDLCSDYFLLGVGFNGSSLSNQTLNIPEYTELSKYHFNSCTITNLMKCSYILNKTASQNNAKAGNEEPALSFSSIDPTLKWCYENGMKMRGHTLVWHTQAPEWFFKEGYLDNGNYVSKETMLFRMESYIKQLLEHVQTEFPGVIYCWDVVNEAVEPSAYDPESFFMCRTENAGTPNPWYVTIGSDYVEMAFTYARKYADPDVKLFYNDYNTYQSPKTGAIYDLCKYLKEKGLIDGIGMQGYWGTDSPSTSKISSTIKKFAELELEIQITELSISIKEETDAQFEKQAKKYADLFQMFHDVDTQAGGPANITSVTLFGLVDHYRSGDTTNTRIFDKNYQPKPAFYSIKKVMCLY